MRRLLIGLLLATLATLPVAASQGPATESAGGWLEPVQGFFSQILEMLEGYLPALGSHGADGDGSGGASIAACGGQGAQDGEIGPCIEPHGVASGGADAVAACEAGGGGDADSGPCVEPHG